MKLNPTENDVDLRSLLWGTFIIVSVFLPNTAVGRAGGGGGYSGGGGFSGGSFSGGGFSGGGSVSLENTTPGDWAFFVLFVAAALALTWVSNRLQQKYPILRGDLFSGKGGTKGNYDVRSRVPAGAHRSHLSRLRSVDPAFDWTSFSKRFEVAFLKIQGAWQYHQLERIQHFVSDGILERFTLQLQEQRDGGYRDHMERIKVLETNLAEFQAGDVFESITIQVTASAVDYRVHYDSGKFHSGDRAASEFTEYWSFVRRRGVLSRVITGLIEGACPNCSAPISLTQTGHCSSCQAVVKSGEYDWVLSEITQACEWAPHHEDRDGCLRGLRAHDQGLSSQHIEDRASVIFWRHIMAERTGNIRAIQKVATGSYVELFRSTRLASNATGWRKRIINCSVGAVDLLGVVREDSFDYAVIRVKWAGKPNEINDETGKERTGSWARRKSFLILARHGDAKTNLQSALKSSHCPNCAAPESDVAATNCYYCGEVLNTGQHDWVLNEYHNSADFAAQQWNERMRRNAMGTRPMDGENDVFETGGDETHSPMDLLANMVVVLAADGQVLPGEHEALLHFAQKNEIPESMLQGLINAALKGELEAQAPEDPRAGRRWLRSLTKLALVDVLIDLEETAALTRLGSRYGLVRADIEIMIAKGRAELKRQAAA